MNKYIMREDEDILEEFIRNTLYHRFDDGKTTARTMEDFLREVRPKGMMKIHSLFISSNDKGKTIDQRYEDFAKAWDKGKEYFKDKPFAIVFPRNDTPKTTKNESLWFLGGLLQTIADADAVVFVGDWHRSRDCLVEHDCCVRFGIPILYA